MKPKIRGNQVLLDIPIGTHLACIARARARAMGLSIRVFSNSFMVAARVKQAEGGEGTKMHRHVRNPPTSTVRGGGRGQLIAWQGSQTIALTQRSSAIPHLHFVAFPFSAIRCCSLCRKQRLGSPGTRPGCWLMLSSDRHRRRAARLCGSHLSGLLLLARLPSGRRSPRAPSTALSRKLPPPPRFKRLVGGIALRDQLSPQ